MLPHGLKHFGRNDHLLTLATLTHPAPDDFFGFPTSMAWKPARVKIRRVQEIAAVLHKRIHHSACRLLVDRPAPLHRAETKARNFQTGVAKSVIIHISFLSAESLASR